MKSEVIAIPVINNKFILKYKTAQEFYIYKINSDRIIQNKTIANLEDIIKNLSKKQILDIFTYYSVNTLITCAINQMEIDYFSENGIKTIYGSSLLNYENPDTIINDYIKNILEMPKSVFIN